MESFVIVLVVVFLLAIAAAGASVLVRLARRVPSDSSNPAAVAKRSEALYGIVSRLEAHYDAAARPQDLVGHATFGEGVAHLSSPEYGESELLGYVTGSSAVIAILALEALGSRSWSSGTRERLLAVVNEVAPWPRHFILRALDRTSPPPAELVGQVLAVLDASWTNLPAATFLREFLAARLAAGERVDLAPHVAKMTTEQAEGLRKLLSEMGDPAIAALADGIGAGMGGLVDRPFLESVGQVWTDATLETEGQTIEHARLAEDVARVEAALFRQPPRSVAIVGEPGVGKSVVARCVAARRMRDGWTVFAAGQPELVAGMSYVGQFESRLQELVKRLSGGRRILWIVPDFHHLHAAGRHRYSPAGALDVLLPLLERGELVVLGETQPAAWERLAQEKPRVTAALDVVRIEALGPEEARRVVDAWAATRGGACGETLVPAAVRAEAMQLALQFLGDKAMPGGVLELLERTRRRLDAAGVEPKPIELDALVTTLSQMTGLPASILDERQGLDLAALRDLFERRVLGQPEAVECLVERIALLKAGLTDPGKPVGVFLFVGPTGTGKTAVAKTLASFLFGSPARMIRLDMTEFQTPDSLGRILGEAEPDSGTPLAGALVDRVRRQPFSVVLLDEFEKAHPQVWDVFLQVFDDGRLTDRRGSTVDFRHTIVILTSNLGSRIPSGQSLGFPREGLPFSPTAVARTVERTFRREFLNRLDRIVVFRPLGRDTMRDILRKELAEAFRRRGLRNRNWAVEYDASALSFLLDRGFTPDLGARPLRRAIERYLLAPLSLAIVERRTPAGDQFLLVRAERDRLVVEFVDPDAPESAAEPTAVPATGKRTLRCIAFEATGGSADVARLANEIESARARIAEPEWEGRKRHLLARTRGGSFWEDPGRFEILGRVEFVDRIEGAVEAASALFERLTGGEARRRKSVPRELARRLAELLWLIEIACDDLRLGRPSDAYLLVESVDDDPFARRVGTMYGAWAELRRMQTEVLFEGHAPGTGVWRVLRSVSGFGAHTLLAPEAGLHLLESPHPPGFRRTVARVRVAPQPESAPQAKQGRLNEALRALADSAPSTIVRRYREEPSPLVRDAVRGWRTGRLDRVLAGEFDLIEADAGEVESNL